MKHSTIDYTKLNDRIVEQAYNSFGIITKEEKQKLIQEKVERAAQYLESLKNTPFGY